MITELGGNMGDHFVRNIFCDNRTVYAKKAELAKRCGNIDVYQSIFQYDTENETDIKTCDIVAPLYFDLDTDIDSESDYERIKTMTLRVVQYIKTKLFVPESDIGIYFSGCKGFHVIVNYRVFGIKPLYELDQVYKAWATHLVVSNDIDYVDLSIYERRRLLRIANTINGKTGLYKVRVPLSILKDSTYRSIQHFAAKPKLDIDSCPAINKKSAVTFLSKSMRVFERKPKKRTFELPKEKRDLFPCIVSLLDNGVEKGSRNNVTVALANSLMQSGYQKDEVVELLYDWNELNDPPLTMRELNTTIQSAFDMVRNDKRYGCQALRALGVCVDKNCMGEKR